MKAIPGTDSSEGVVSTPLQTRFLGRARIVVALALTPTRILAPTLALTLTLTLLSSAAPARAQTYPNVKVNVQANNPEETAIGINPTNPENVLGVAQSEGYLYYPSFDAGSTWSEGHLPDLYDLGDPVIAFGPEGYAYYSFIGTYTHAGIFVNRSTDGGVDWRSQGTAVIQHDSGAPFEDKDWTAVDWTQGPHRGYVYVAWTHFDVYDSRNPADSTQVYFSHSTDRGLTFSTPLRVSDRGGSGVDSSNAVQGAVPSIGPDGTVYLAWSGPRGIEFDHSTNAGQSWGTDRVITDQPGGWDLNVPGIYRCNGLPETKTDLSAGPHQGRLYVLWSDDRNGDIDVWLISSDDGGVTWGPRTRVNNDPVGNGADQFFPWMDVDPADGTIYVVFYDRREHPGSTATDVDLAVSIDGGASFLNEKISASPFTPNANVFFGDYIGISALSGEVRPLWMRLDGNTLTLWTALIQFNPASGPGPLTAGSIQVIPNPMSTGARILLPPLLSGPRWLDLVDVSGRLVQRFRTGPASVDWDGRDLSGRAVSNGVYFLRLDRRPVHRLVVVK